MTLSVTPPDDTGTDTFSRFYYQAYVAVPICLEAALSGTPTAVYMEHFEDVAAEYPDRWRFLQIKTRDADRGPWRFSQLTGHGGALTTLLRTHRATEGTNATLEVHLEGPITRKADVIGLLETAEGRRAGELIDALAASLAIETEEATAFAERLRLSADLPTRTSIRDRNFRLLSDHAAGLPAGEIDAIHDRLLMAITDAMNADRLEDDWPSAVVESDPVPAIQRRLVAKRLTAEQLGSLAAGLQRRVRPLLSRLTSTGAPSPSVLEEKLIRGGATPVIIEDAKRLRAWAVVRERENEAAGVPDLQLKLEDLRERLQIRSNAAIARSRSNPEPAVEVWADLLHTLTLTAGALDHSDLFASDPDLLLGEVCELSDLCRTGWGTADAR